MKDQVPRHAVLIALTARAQATASLLTRHRTFKAAWISIALAVLYWGPIASDRYVSEARLVIDRTDSSSAQTVDFASILGGGRSGHDLLLLREYLLSVDMLKKLDAKLNLRAHYSDWHRDPLSRMWFEDASQEWFYRHYLSRVGAEVDDVSGVLHLSVQAYTPEMAKAIASFLVEEGERFMNSMGHRLAGDQVKFLEGQVAGIKERVLKARTAVIEYQNSKGLVSPQSTVESLVGIVSRIEGQLSELRAKRQIMLGFLSADAPDVFQINLQIAALERQLTREQGRLASRNGQPLNRVAEEFQRLQLEAEFSQDVYRTALVALEKGRIESTRTLKKISILQTPTLPEYPMEPRRIYNIIVFALSVLVLAGIIHLFVAIIRDHQD